MSWSRGAWLGLIASTVVVVGFRNRRTALLTFVTLALLALLLANTGAGWLPGFVGERLNDLAGYFVAPDPARTEITDANFSVLERLAHWQAGLRMFADHPWLGVGIGNYAARYAEYQLPHWYAALGHAHNIFINFLAETGILGAAAFAAFWLGVPWLAWRAAARQQHPARAGYVKSLAVGLAGTWAFVTVHNLFDNLFVQHIQLQLALLMVALVAVGGLIGPARDSAEQAS
jgi:O-antigen ligase